MRIQRGLPFLAIFVIGTSLASTSPAQQAPSRIRVGGNVQQARLIKKPNPEYPPLARQARIQGTVRLQVVVARDGTIQQVDVISGHPLLVQPSLEAVRQWQYQPTLLNGEPVEVQTTVDVVFTLSDDPSSPGPRASMQPAESPADVAPATPEMKRASALLQQWEVDAAISTLRDAIRLQPENLQLRLDLARVLLRNKRDVAGAVREYSYVLGREGSLAVCRDLAEVHRDMFDFEAAARQYRTCLNLDLTDERSWFDLAFVLYEKGDLESATRALREAAALHPNPAKLHANLADRLAKGRRPDAALAQARETIRLRPSDPQSVALLERLLRDRADAEVQVARLRGYLSLNPNSITAWQRLGSSLLAYFDDVDGAIAAGRECIDREPNTEEHFARFARLVANRKGMDFALAELKAYVDLHPDSPGARQAYARMLFLHGDVEQALVESRRAVELDPESRAAHDTLAVALAASGNAQAARIQREQRNSLPARPSPRREADPELEAYLRTGQPPAGPEVNETSAVGALRMLNTACVQYQATYDGGYPPSLASLGPAGGSNIPSAQQAGLITAALASGARNGYLFTFIAGPIDDRGRVTSYEIYADPAQPGVTGNRYFFTNQSGVIRVSTGSRASAASPPIQ